MFNLTKKWKSVEQMVHIVPLLTCVFLRTFVLPKKIEVRKITEPLFQRPTQVSGYLEEIQLFLQENIVD